MTQLTKHFSLSELTVTQQRGLDNTPRGSMLLANLQRLAEKLEEVRAYLDHPIIVTSGYRSSEVNKAVGGSPNSAHMFGHAADFIVPRSGTPKQVCNIIKASSLHWDKLIYEGDWVHLSFDPRMRGECWTAHFDKSGTTYTMGI